jgi:hypothetical protein
MNIIKILTINLMVFVLGLSPAFSDASYDEGPTVIIVGSEQNKLEKNKEPEPENIDPHPIGENNGGETSPEDMDNEIENPVQQYMEEDDQDIEEPEAFE